MRYPLTERQGNFVLQQTTTVNLKAR